MSFELLGAPGSLASSFSRLDRFAWSLCKTCNGQMQRDVAWNHLHLYCSDGCKVLQCRFNAVVPLKPSAVAINQQVRATLKETLLQMVTAIK